MKENISNIILILILSFFDTHNVAYAEEESELNITLTQSSPLPDIINYWFFVPELNSLRFIKFTSSDNIFQPTEQYSIFANKYQLFSTPIADENRSDVTLKNLNYKTSLSISSKASLLKGLSFYGGINLGPVLLEPEYLASEKKISFYFAREVGIAYNTASGISLFLGYNTRNIDTKVVNTFFSGRIGVETIGRFSLGIKMDF